jgi:hypothetical protein
MIEICTKNWPLWLWHEVIDWCYNTYGVGEWNKNWFFKDEYSLYIHEKYLPFFILRLT